MVIGPESGGRGSVGVGNWASEEKRISFEYFDQPDRKTEHNRGNPIQRDLRQPKESRLQRQTSERIKGKARRSGNTDPELIAWLEMSSQTDCVGGISADRGKMLVTHPSIEKSMSPSESKIEKQ